MSHAGGRRWFLQGAATTALLHGFRPTLVRADDAARQSMARAATAFLATLDAGQRRRAAFAFDDAERVNWHYVPRRRKGLPVKDMPAPARARTHELMNAALSAVGYDKAVNVMRLEEVLRELETLGFFRDAEVYYVSIFGTPGTEGPWGWRLEGHHLSLNFTLVPGGPLRGLRALREEQDLGLALARSLAPAHQPRLVIATSSLGDVVSGPGRLERLKEPAGIGLVDMTSEQRALALRLVETYARNMRADIAEHELRAMHDAGLERIRFAGAGPIDPARPHYYRLHGPTVLIEYDNTQNDANHIHSVWHDPRNSFGADLLRAHYLTGHRHG